MECPASRRTDQFRIDVVERLERLHRARRRVVRLRLSPTARVTFGHGSFIVSQRLRLVHEQPRGFTFFAEINLTTSAQARRQRVRLDVRRTRTRTHGCEVSIDYRDAAPGDVICRRRAYRRLLAARRSQHRERTTTQSSGIFIGVKSVGWSNAADQIALRNMSCPTSCDRRALLLG